MHGRDAACPALFGSNFQFDQKLKTGRSQSTQVLEKVQGWNQSFTRCIGAVGGKTTRCRHTETIVNYGQSINHLLYRYAGCKEKGILFLLDLCENFLVQSNWEIVNQKKVNFSQTLA